MVRFWNMIYYFVYKLDYRFHLFFNKINPVCLFYKLPFAKRHFAKMGMDPVAEVNKAFKRPDSGISSFRAGAFMILNFMIFAMGLFNVYFGIVEKINSAYFLLTIPIALLVNYKFLFWNDKYLIYFKQFDKFDKQTKRKWGWISFFTLVTIWLFCIGSFMFLTYSLHKNG